LISFLDSQLLLPNMFPYGFGFFVPEAQSELAEPSTEHERAAAEEYVTHLAHIPFEFIGYVIEAGVSIRTALIRREES
jgi:hypothetical protein